MKATNDVDDKKRHQWGTDMTRAHRREFLKFVSTPVVMSSGLIDRDGDGDYLDDILGLDDETEKDLVVGKRDERESVDSDEHEVYFAYDTNEWFRGGDEWSKIKESVGVSELDLTITPTWAREHTWDAAQVMQQIGTPSSPGSGYNKLYFKSDDNLYKQQSNGTETQVGGSGDIASDDVGRIDAQSTIPSSPSTNDLWIDTS